MNPEHIEWIGELSPLQQAELAKTLQSPGSGGCVSQTTLRLSGRLDLVAFEQAWRWLVARHPILRTAFFWEDLEAPRQVVFREAELSLDRALAADRARGFDLTTAPLLHLALFELGEDEHRLVWTQHPLVTDGWSQGLLLRELWSAYAAFAEGREPVAGAARSFRDYLGWLRRQDPGATEGFWRRRLAGFSTPTYLAAGVSGSGDARRRALVVPMAAARRHRLTLSTLVQGAWGLLLAREHGRQDVVFGVSVAGRPGDLPGAETIAGPLGNTLPLRIEVTPERRVGEWLAALQESRVAAWRHEHAALAE